MTVVRNEWRLIEKDQSIEINENEDPLLEKEFSTYIQISERPNPGIRPIFNGMSNVSTINVRVTGLNMIFGATLDAKSADMPAEDKTDNNGSPLDGLTDRVNVENLYLYADTIIVKRQLHFPQTNVHIHARRLIMTDRGEIRTTPNPIADFSKAGTSEKVSNGKSAPDSGNVYLHVKEFSSSRNENSLLPEEIDIPDYLFRQQKDFNTINMHPALRMFPYGSELEFEFSGDKHKDLYIMLVEGLPTKLNIKTPSKFHGIIIKRDDNVGFSLNASAIGYSSSAIIYNTKKDMPSRIKIVHEMGKLKFLTATKRGTFKEVGILKSPGLKNANFIGISNTEADANHITDASLTIKRLPPLFTLNGADGQHGQLGGLLPIPKASQEGDLAHPVTEPKVWEHVFDFDLFKASKENAWYSPNLSLLNISPVLFVKLTIYNVHGKNNEKIVKLGNAKAENPYNGADTFASGNGGNGGNSGILHYSAATCAIEEVDVLPGALGISPVIKGGTGSLGVNAYHIELLFVHYSTPVKKLKEFGIKQRPKRSNSTPVKTTKTIPSRNGHDSEGSMGKMGKSGAIKKIPDQVNAWIHPFMLERTVQFAKNEFMRGNRHVAAWIVDTYSKEIPDQSSDLVNYDMQLADLVNEIRVLENRLNSRLDYFGKPIGWVPRLSTLTNIQLMKFIHRNTVKALFYAETILNKDLSESQVRKQLNFAITHLRAEVKKEQKFLADAHKEIPKVKDKLNKIDEKIFKVNTKVRSLNDTITNEAIQKGRDQALYTGTIQIFSGLCHLIPVGQPYVGQIAGGILDVVKDIDIHAENPFEEALGVTGSLSSKLGGFISDNGDDLTKTITADLEENIESNESSISEVQKKADEFTEKLKEHKPIFNTVFESKQFEKLKQELSIAQQIDSFEKLEFYSSSDYADLIDNIDFLKTEIKNAASVSSEDKKILEADLAKVVKKQKLLKKEKEKLEATRDKRAATLEKAGKVTRAVGQSLSKVSSGLQGMMVNVDKEDPAFKKEIQKAHSGEYKEEFTNLSNEIDSLNDEKLPLINRMMKLQQDIDIYSGSVMNKMAQIAAFSDQRAQMTAGVLTAETRLYMQKVMEDSRELLLEHVDNLVKSFQYRYLQRVDSDFYNIHQLVKDIRTFEDKDSSISNRESFKNAYDFALQSQFNSLTRKLLADMQGSAAPTQDHFTLKIDRRTENHNGVKLLNMLNRIGSVNFRLHSLKGGSSKGSDEYFNYRISGIEFQKIKVKTEVEDLSFRFGIEHSGRSVIRNVRDKQFYFFTTVHSADVENQGNSYTRTWSATFNRADINLEKGEYGLTNSKHVVHDEEALSALLTQIDKSAKIKYKEHLPAATSMLTLQIHDNKLDKAFEIEELTLRVDYELKQ